MFIVYLLVQLLFVLIIGFSFSLTWTENHNKNEKKIGFVVGTVFFVISNLFTYWMF
jgi:hypothetical protein